MLGGGFGMSLYDKKWDGICPVPECNCFHQDENDWLSTRDVKEAIKELENELELQQVPKRTIYLILKQVFGKELCSEEELE